MGQPSRRGVLRSLVMGAAVAASGTAVAAAKRQRPFAVDGGSAPWELIYPLSPGARLAGGWLVQSLSQVRKGASILTLQHPQHGEASIHVCAHDGQPQGVASTAMLDLVIMDGRDGDQPTNERLGRVIMDIASRIRKNETSDTADLRTLSRMMPHNARIDAYGPENL